MADVPMIEIDRTAPMVFNVPAKGGENHSNVTPWHLHAVHVAFDETKY